MSARPPLTDLIAAYLHDHTIDEVHNLLGACASVGIEHGRSTEDELFDYLADWWNKR